MQENRPIRVVHLSTSYTGGAGIAARRLNAKLNDLGIDSSFYAHDKRQYVCQSKEFKIKKNFIFLLARYFATILSKLTLRVSFFSIYSAPGLSIKSIENFYYDKNTILHVHNWFNLFSHRQIKKLCSSGLPLIFTLHDDRLLTGGCHSTLSCSNYLRSCNACPEFKNSMNRIISKNANNFERLFIEPQTKIKFIAPSKYIKNKAMESSILKKQNIEFIPNFLGDSLSLTGSTEKICQSNEVITVGIANINYQDPLKGGDFVLDLIKIIEEKALPIRLVFLNKFQDDSKNLFWNQIDCLLVPSRGDNSPNVIHESKSYGIPFIGTEVGGIPELATKDIDILISLSNLNSESILLAIEQMRRNTSSVINHDKIKKSLFLYSKDSIKNLLALYQEVLNSSE